jgi:hypothetical protein
MTAKLVHDRAIAQAVSRRRRPTAAVRVRAQVRTCGTCGGQSVTGAGLLRVLGFPYQFSFHRLLHIHHLSSGGWYNGPISGRRTKWTQSHPTPRNLKLVHLIIQIMYRIFYTLSNEIPSVWQQCCAVYNPPVRTGAAIEMVDKRVDDKPSCATHALPFGA